MKVAPALVTVIMLALGVVNAQSGRSVLFIGNSFTFGAGSPVRFYRGDSVTDLNNEGLGGVPALFKSFTAQAGLDYDVYLETRGGSGIEFHLEHKRDVIGQRPWDVVVMHGQSTLDFDKPRDPTKLIATSGQMAEFLRERNRNVEIHLMATWSRADQTYQKQGAWAGKPIDAMARDVRAASDKAAAGAGLKSVIPVGEAWSRAMQAGIADPNPYDGIEAGKLNLWTYDAYHASTHGYYLEALVVFGRLTGRDPRSLGENECSAFELGFARPDVKALQQVAFDQLAAEGGVTAAPLATLQGASPTRCLPAGLSASAQSAPRTRDVDLSAPAPRLPNGLPDLSGVWQGGGPIGDISEGLPPGEKLPLLPESVAKMATLQSKDDPEANCLPTGVPRIAPYPWRIIQLPTHVYFLFEGNIHSFRQIFVDGRPHPPDPDPTWYGHSIGRYEGDTLVIDTIGYNDKFWFDFKGHPHTTRLRTIERWTRINMGTLINEVTIDDPGAYSRPFTVKFTAKLAPGMDLMEYICNENNQDPPFLVGPPTLPGDPARPLGTLGR